MTTTYKSKDVLFCVLSLCRQQFRNQKDLLVKSTFWLLSTTLAVQVIIIFLTDSVEINIDDIQVG